MKMLQKVPAAVESDRCDCVALDCRGARTRVCWPCSFSRSLHLLLWIVFSRVAGRHFSERPEHWRPDHSILRISNTVTSGAYRRRLAQVESLCAVRYYIRWESFVRAVLSAQCATAPSLWRRHGPSASSCEHFWAFVFTAMFLRIIGATATGAVVAGLLYIFSGFMTVWQGQSMPETAIWLPLICYSVVRLHDDRSIISTIILTFAFAMPALAGHPETMVHLTIVGALLAVFLAPLRSPASTSRNPVRFLTCFAAAGFLSLGVAAVQLVPSVEWFQNSNRGLD